MTPPLAKIAVLHVDPENVEDTLLDALMQMIENVPEIETATVLMIARSLFATVLVNTCESYDSTPSRTEVLRRYLEETAESCLRWSKAGTLREMADEIRRDCAASTLHRTQAPVVG